MPSRMKTMNFDGYNISMDFYCKALLLISCFVGRYINSRFTIIIIIICLTSILSFSI